MNKDYSEMDESQIKQEQTNQKEKNAFKNVTEKGIKHLINDSKNNQNITSQHNAVNEPITDTKVPKTTSDSQQGNNVQSKEMANAINENASKSAVNNTSKATTGSATGTATGTGTTISSGAAAGGAGAGAAGGAGAGATAGSTIAPGVGTAVGAAVGGATEAAKKASPIHNQAKPVDSEESAKAKGTAQGKDKKESILDDNLLIKVALTVLAIIVTVALLIAPLMTSILDTVAAPAMAIWKQAQGLIEFTDTLLSDIGLSSSSEATYEDIVNLIVEKIGESMEDAYTDVCYKEVYQIAEENEYDIDLTMESYKKTKFPYKLDGEDCNVNYAELLSLITLSGKFDSEHYKDFDYDEFCRFLDDDEFQRCLYDLDVVPTYIINTAALGEGESGEVSVSNGVVTVEITRKDGSKDTYTGDSAKEYYILYGEVSVDQYPVRKLYDYYGVDPYARHEVYNNMPNYKALSQMNYFSKYYYPDIFWGTETQSPIAKSYKKLTGELTTDVMNCYEQDLRDLSLYKDTEIYWETPYYSQIEGELANLNYYYKGQTKPVHTWGCCLVSMCMVCSYFSPETSAMEAYQYYKNDLKGSLNRSQMAEHYGFKQLTTDDLHFNSEKVMGELAQGRLVIAHIRPLCLGSRGGHYIVLTGYSNTSEEPYFTVNDPAHADRTTLTVAECVANMDGYRSYGK